MGDPCFWPLDTAVDVEMRYEDGQGYGVRSTDSCVLIQKQTGSIDCLKTDSHHSCIEYTVL